MLNDARFSGMYALASSLWCMRANYCANEEMVVGWARLMAHTGRNEQTNFENLISSTINVLNHRDLYNDFLSLLTYMKPLMK